MILNEPWFCIGLITALLFYLSPLWRADRRIKTASILVKKILLLPMFLQIMFNGFVIGIVSVITMALFYAVFRGFISTIPLLWGFGWLVGAIISGMIRQFMR
ncbi:MAG: hypothetical protein HGA19_08525 [Oscillochloris sp.]|nr:hypothetical protein [Oscillochloris sp.]